MIIQNFSDYLKENYKNENDKTTVELLSIWIKEKIENPPKTLVDKVIQREIYLAKNKNTKPLPSIFFLPVQNMQLRLFAICLLPFDWWMWRGSNPRPVG